MARTISLMVRDRGKLVDGPLLDRPVRLLPSGEAGAVYVGQVYPLYVGDVIDLNDAPLSKAQCPGFAVPNQKLAYRAESARSSSSQPLLRSYVETNRFGHYLVFDASEEQAGFVADRLRKSALGLVRWGESYRVADDGNQYNWFARLEFRGPRDQCLAELRSLFATSQPMSAIDSVDRTGRTLIDSPPSGAASDGTLAEEQTKLTDLRAQYAALLERVDREVRPLGLLAERVEQLTRERDELQTTVGELQRSLEMLGAQNEAAKRSAQQNQRIERERARGVRRELVRLETENLQLRRDAEDARRRLEASNRVDGDSGSVSEESRELIARVKQSQAAEAHARGARSDLQRRLEDEYVPRSEHEELQQVVAMIEHDDATLRSLCRDQKVQIQNLTDEKSELENEAEDRKRAGHPNRRRSPADFDQLLREIFPHLVFSSESIDVMEQEFVNRAKLFRILAALECQDGTVRLKKTSHRVKEVDEHIATGDPSGADMGRIYTRPHSDGRLEVFVHRKKNPNEQELFLKRITRTSILQPAAAQRVA